MFNPKEKDKQVEFFNDLPGNSKKSRKHKLRLAKIFVSLSYENIIILSIGLIMLLIVCYSLGVERGKDLAQLIPLSTEESEDIKVEQEQVQKSPMIKSPKPQEKKIKVKLAQAKSVITPSPYIQVASFHTDKYAQKEIEQLKNKGYRPFLAQWGKYSVVCVGGYKDKDEARKALKDLKKLYADCILRSK